MSARARIREMLNLGPERFQRVGDEIVEESTGWQFKSVQGQPPRVVILLRRALRETPQPLALGPGRMPL